MVRLGPRGSLCVCVELTPRRVLVRVSPRSEAACAPAAPANPSGAPPWAAAPGGPEQHPAAASSGLLLEALKGAAGQEHGRACWRVRLQCVPHPLWAESCPSSRCRPAWLLQALLSQPPSHRGVFSQPSSEHWCSQLWASVSLGMGLPACLCSRVPTTGAHACTQCLLARDGLMRWLGWRHA